MIHPAEGKSGDGWCRGLGLATVRLVYAAAKTDVTMQSWGHTRVRAGGIGVVLALTLLSGCSTYDSLIGSRPSTAPSAPPAAASSPSSSSSFTDRFSKFVLGGSATDAQGGTQGATMAPSDIDCPAVEIRQGASTFAQSAGDSGSAALSLRYQANFLKFARECALRGGNVTLKVGIEGRVILGPAGASGPITLPVRLAVVKEGLEPRTIWTKFYMVPVTLLPGQPNVLFTHIEEDMSFPMPPAGELDKYVIYVGFDPDSAALEKKPTKPAPKTKAKR
jgi:hypothetical protein